MASSMLRNTWYSQSRRAISRESGSNSRCLGLNSTAFFSISAPLGKDSIQPGGISCAWSQHLSGALAGSDVRPCSGDQMTVWAGSTGPIRSSASSSSTGVRQIQTRQLGESKSFARRKAKIASAPVFFGIEQGRRNPAEIGEPRLVAGSAVEGVVVPDRPDPLADRVRVDEQVEPDIRIQHTRPIQGRKPRVQEVSRDVRSGLVGVRLANVSLPERRLAYQTRSGRANSVIQRENSVMGVTGSRR